MVSARRSGRSSRDPRDSRRSAPPGRESARSGSSRRGSREEDDPHSSGRRSARGSVRGGAGSKDTTIIIAGVVGAVVLLGGAAILFSGGGKKPVQREERAPPPKAPASVRDWYSTGRDDGMVWASRTKDRGNMAGAGDPFAEGEVLRMADMQTSNWYNKGLRNDKAGQERYIKGFRDGVKAVTGR